MSGDLFAPGRNGQGASEPAKARAKPIVNLCAVCGASACFGFDSFSAAPARWACLTHRDDVRKMWRPRNG